MSLLFVLQAKRKALNTKKHINDLVDVFEVMAAVHKDSAPNYTPKPPVRC
jgi:hypothetical protein